MPVEAQLFLALVLAVFAVFMGTLAWGERYSNARRDEAEHDGHPAE